MAVDTLQCDTDSVADVRYLAPRRLVRSLDAGDSRYLAESIQRTIQAAEAGIETRFWHADHRGEKLVVELGPRRVATLTVHDGTLEMSWKALRALKAHGCALAVRGSLNDAVASRLHKRFPGWSLAPPQSVPSTGEFRTALGSWQVTTPLLRCNGREIYREGRRGFAFTFDRDGVLDHFDCGVTLPTLEEWPPR
jgi:hypothetical protein